MIRLELTSNPNCLSKPLGWSVNAKLSLDIKDGAPIHLNQLRGGEGEAKYRILSLVLLNIMQTSKQARKISSSQRRERCSRGEIARVGGKMEERE